MFFVRECVSGGGGEGVEAVAQNPEILLIGVLFIKFYLHYWSIFCSFS